ncbi:MAG: AAA family ATPase [Pseudomonadota bacterium]
MRFSKIRLTGFKSFVDPTELIIKDGLTGVVGPNGCGKSNLLEALRWVMGENRPTAMRGGGMEDVIFAGAESRAARNDAEVALLLDNSERLAPAAFNQEDKLEIIRRITRDVGSAYKVNGKDSRARDIQMLFADASTGAHSPALVRQGQISELINAKPKARRRILEEAAGISGLYQRRHEAELKLKNAETNLGRVDDVVDQLDGQLRSLEKQARQAQRYREIGEELRKSEGLLLYRRWKEADQTAADAKAELTEATKTAGSAQTEAASALKAREASEAQLPPLREEQAVASAIHQRLIVQRDTLTDQETRAKDQIETLNARIEQLANDITREGDLNKDAEETIKTLNWEQDQITKASDGFDAKLEQANTEAREAANVLSEKESDLDKLTEDAARLAARHQSAERMLTEAQALLEKRAAEAETAKAAVAEIAEKLEAAEAALQTAVSAKAEAEATIAETEKALLDAEAARVKAQAADSDARAALSQAEGEANALRAETGALEKVIARESDGTDQLIDKTSAEAGFEAALGAALADDLKAPLIGPDGASGWAKLPDYDATAELPDGAVALHIYVNAPAELTRRLSQIGLIEAGEGAKLQAALKPGQRLVSKAGDLWRWDGYRQSAEDAPSSAALRLKQMNRLKELQTSLGGAEDVLATAQKAFDENHAALENLIAAERTARENRKQADEALADANRKLSSATAERDALAGKRETMELAEKRLEAESTQARDALSEAESGLKSLGDLDAARENQEAMKIGVEAARVTMISKRSMADDIRREGEARTKRRQEIIKEVSGWQHRLTSAEARMKELAKRKEDSEAALGSATAAPEEIAAKREEMNKAIFEAETRQKEASEKLAEAEAAHRKCEMALRDSEGAASSAREARARAEAVSEAAETQVTMAAERINEEMQTTPQKLLESLDTDPEKMPKADRVEEDVTRLRRQRDALGAVNLRAEEDAKEVSEERDALYTEREDLEGAIRELRKGIAGLNKEGRERLLNAFEEVNKNFSLLFKRLFNGGEANLVLVESDDPLEAGLEIMCQPPGKKLSTLSLLSGGEQTLTASALIFAVFLANPAPICVLDEVDAPLDDANVNRFCDMLDEMVSRTDTRFLIITHHAVTMARMDRLFGVTMQEQGVSQLVSVDLQAAEELVDA